MIYTAEKIQEWMVSKLAELLSVDANSIDIQQSLEDYGLDSSRAMVLVTQAEKIFGVEISPVLFMALSEYRCPIATLGRRYC
jgi:acyl carrier protein